MPFDDNAHTAMASPKRGLFGLTRWDKCRIAILAQSVVMAVALFIGLKNAHDDSQRQDNQLEIDCNIRAEGRLALRDVLFDLITPRPGTTYTPEQQVRYDEIVAKINKLPPITCTDATGG